MAGTEEERIVMLKVLVFDGGYGGEFFADALEKALPVIEVDRVIAWREADTILKKPRKARKVAEAALLPYIGGVDLIVLANHLLTATSLKYFVHKYPEQKFLGLDFAFPDTFVHRDTLILATHAVTKTRGFHRYVAKLSRPHRILCPDNWAHKIDDGELRPEEIKYILNRGLEKPYFHPEEIVLACAQFSDIKDNLKDALGYDLKIYDSFRPTISKAQRLLGLRGSSAHKK